MSEYFGLNNSEYQQNEDGTWSQAVPLPFYGLRKHCVLCSKGFWREENYRKHYVATHTDGIKYNRTSRGLMLIVAPTKEPNKGENG